MKPFRKRLMEPLEHFLELGGIKKDITLLVLSGIAVILSLAGVQPLPFDIAWAAIILCGVPIILEAIIGLVTEFDIKADVLVSLALIDRGHRADRCRPHLGRHRPDHPRRDHSGGVLPLCAGAGNAHRHHGGHRQCHEARFSCPRRRRAGAPCPGENFGL